MRAMPLTRRTALICALLLFCAACGGKKPPTAATSAQPDKFLMDRGAEETTKKHWLKARTYFQQLVDNYPQSPYRADAKLAIGDAHLLENSSESVVLAAAEYKEFLSFYPTHARADYAQFKIAMSHYSRMRASERDQTETRQALAEFDIFFEKYPDSALTPEVRLKWRDARDRLTGADYRIGVFYFKARWYPGAVARLREVLAVDPGFSGRDGVYFYLAESLARTDKKAEAIPYFERLLTEHEKSPFVLEAKKRLQALKPQ